jgi:hypothetical protein
VASALPGINNEVQLLLDQDTVESNGEEVPLGWLPPTTAAVSLRLYALDAAILYTPGSQPGRETLQVPPYSFWPRLPPCRPEHTCVQELFIVCRFNLVLSSRKGSVCRALVSWPEQSCNFTQALAYGAVADVPVSWLGHTFMNGGPPVDVSGLLVQKGSK